MGANKKGLLDNIIDRKIDKLFNKVPNIPGLNKDREKVRAKIKKEVLNRLTTIVLAYILPFILIICIIVGATMACYNAIMKMVTVANSAIEIWDGKSSSMQTGNVGVNQRQQVQNLYGVYPIDNNLRIKQEMLEICENIGKLYGITAEMVLAVAMVETNAMSIPLMENGLNGSLYTDLCIGYSTGQDGKTMFVDGPNTGKFKDMNGNLVVDPLKVGELRPDATEPSVIAAIGPYQFYSPYVHNFVSRMYVNENGKTTSRENMKMMSWFDEQLGFMRPNPFYFPDAALNATAKIVGHMKDHANQLIDIENLNLPKQIKDEILFVYAGDAYHGDMDSPSKSKESKILHDAMAELYSDIYITYKEKGIIVNSFGDFSNNIYNQAAVRAILGGTQFTTRGNIDFDGTFNHSSKVVKQDNNGKYVELEGYKYYQSIIDELSNKTQFKLDYKQIVYDVPATSNSGTNNKFGWMYSFQGLNAANYYSRLWKKQIAEAPKKQVTVGYALVNSLEVPYKYGVKSREELMVAAASLVGKVKYVWGGGLQGTNHITTINPLWRQFSRMYDNAGKTDKSIRPRTSGYWCPIHSASGDDKCAFFSPTYTDAETFLLDRSLDYSKYGNPYAGISPQVLNTALAEVTQAVPYHRLEGLDCAGFVGWAFNQISSDNKYGGDAGSFVSNNKMIQITDLAKLACGDVVTSGDHIVLIVAPTNIDGTVFMTVESVPPEVKFGMLFKPGASKQDKDDARKMIKAANYYFGNIPITSAISEISTSNKTIARASIEYIDTGFENKLADEVIEILKTRMPLNYIGR